MSIRAVVVQYRILVPNVRGGMAHLESTTKDPEENRQIITSSCPRGTGNTDCQAVLGLARHVLDKYGVQKIAHDLQVKALVIA